MADKVVYSTDPSFRQPYPVRLEFVRGGKGSGVTRIDRLIMSPSGKEALLKRFKTRLGCGGTIKDGALEIQGDHRDFIQEELVKEGYKIKRIGG